MAKQSVSQIVNDTLRKQDMKGYTPAIEQNDFTKEEYDAYNQMAKQLGASFAK